MAFTLATRPLAAAPIKARIYDQEGNPVDVEFVAKYNRHTVQQVGDIQASLTNLVMAKRGDAELIKRPDGSPVPEYAYATDLEFLRDKMAGWVGVDGPSGAAVTYSPEALEQMVKDYPELVVPLFQGFFVAHQGVREKN